MTTTQNPNTITIEDEIWYYEEELKTCPASERRARLAGLDTLYRIAEMDEDDIRPELW